MKPLILSVQKNQWKCIEKPYRLHRDIYSSYYRGEVYIAGWLRASVSGVLANASVYSAQNNGVVSVACQRQVRLAPRVWQILMNVDVDGEILDVVVCFVFW